MESLDRHEISQWIRSRSSELGFDACGIARATPLPVDAERLENWITRSFQGEMHYMERNAEKRTDPARLVPGARSVIVLLMNYFPGETLPEQDNYKIAKYAYGRDYHDVIREKLNLLTSELKARAGEFQSRAFTDSAPVLERSWAEKAGLGWIGKNTCLIHPKIGSFFFIGEIITDLELEYDTRQINDLCGGCTKCIEACPTQALVEPRLMDARKCISYLTIEYHGELPAGLEPKFNDWIFGCDICQDVCPWNRKARAHNEPAFHPHPALKSMDKSKWEKFFEDEFREMFSKSAITRTKFSGLRRNIDYLKKGEFQ